jgi:subtilisin-like proprotein convertase family protein
MMYRVCRLLVFLNLAAGVAAQAQTSITFTRAEVTQMANLWETDCLAISPLANAQYPAYTTNWQFIFPHTSISGDGDVHTDMAVNNAGSGSKGNNTGASPIVCEVVNATPGQLNGLNSLSGAQAIFRGIFRFYTEHGGERHFELHPVVQLNTWNGSSFVANTDYHPNITAVADATTHSTATLAAVIDGSQTMDATIQSDNNHINFVFPSPSVNYVQYTGVALGGVTSDSTSTYFLLRPNSVPSATLRCRLVTNTAAATAASGLSANQSVTVNGLTRTDMGAVSTKVTTMSAGQSQTFARPVEVITLGLSGIGPTPTPTPTATPGTTTFSNTASLTMAGAAGGVGKGVPYPSTINATGVSGIITNVTAQLKSVTHPFPSDIDVLLVGPNGQTVMLMSDTGGSHSISNVNLTLSDSAASSLTTGQITSGTYKPTNLNPTGDNDAFPSPAPAKPYGIAFSAFNGTTPNGVWNLFVIDEYTADSGSFGGGWTINITTQPSAPLVTTMAAINVASTTATIRGTINPLGVASTYAFKLGTSPTYSDSQPSQPAGSGTSAVTETLTLVGLKPATTYHYRLSGTNSAGDSLGGSDMTFNTAAFVDTDGDLMPNDYESANNLDPSNFNDAGFDADGDGLTNYQEYTAGTNPQAAGSVLRITLTQRSGDDINITFPSVFGKRYQLQTTNNLGSPWTSLTNNIPGTGQPVTVTDFAVTDTMAKRFYRVQVLP